MAAPAIRIALRREIDTAPSIIIAPPAWQRVRPDAA
jgi:hypothetical protein